MKRDIPYYLMDAKGLNADSPELLMLRAIEKARNHGIGSVVAFGVVVAAGTMTLACGAFYFWSRCFQSARSVRRKT